MNIEPLPSPVQDLASFVTAYLDEDHIPYDLNESRTRLTAYITCNHCITLFIAMMFPDGRLVIVVEFPEVVPVPRIPDCLQLLNWINTQMLDGSFELPEVTERRVRYRHSLPPLGKGLKAEVVNKLIGRHLGAVNLFADAILRVIQTPTPAHEICRGRARGLELSVRMPFN